MITSVNDYDSNDAVMIYVANDSLDLQTTSTSTLDTDWDTLTSDVRAIPVDEAAAGNLSVFGEEATATQAAATHYEEAWQQITKETTESTTDLGLPQSDLSGLLMG